MGEARRSDTTRNESKQHVCKAVEITKDARRGTWRDIFQQTLVIRGHQNCHLPHLSTVLDEYSQPKYLAPDRIKILETPTPASIDPFTT